MKLDSKYFDRIRVKPDEDRLLRSKHVTCDWLGCERPGKHPAPRGRDNEGEYYNFCIDHVRQYNKSYNYFTGMKDKEVIDFQKDARNGHRPTWKMGENAAATSKIKRSRASRANSFKPDIGRNDPFGLFGEAGGQKVPRRRSVGNAERKARNALGLDETAKPEEIKAKYKSLVKKHHPDANGGSRASEDRFREIVRAYDYLRSVKLC